MTLLHLAIVALIQGITEFLPVSSSGHLILVPLFFGGADQGQFIDVAVHIGTLGAVILYFRQDVGAAICGVWPMLRGNLNDPGAKLAFLLIVATIPAVLFGLILKLTGLSDAMRGPEVVGWAMLGFGLVLWWADRRGRTDYKAHAWTLRDAVVMGLWQALALIPGTSRSGITITGARLLGYKREDAARLSMLMSVPIIIASAVLIGGEAATGADAAAWRSGAIAAALAFLSALAALALMMRLLRSTSFTPYVIYRVLLGLVLLGLVYSPTPPI